MVKRQVENNKVRSLQPVFVLLILLFSAASWADIDAADFESDELRKRYQLLVNEMRCPKCQNQNLASSNSPISGDLRKEIRRLLHEGASDQEIADYLVARYGDFVLYRPRWQPTTYLLWFAPFALFLLAVIIWILVVRRRTGSDDVARLSVAPLSSEEQVELDRTLASKPDPDSFSEKDKP